MKLSLFIFSLFLSLPSSFAEQSLKLRELLDQKGFSQKQESLSFSPLGENVQNPSIISKFIVNEFNNKNPFLK